MYNFQSFEAESHNEFLMGGGQCSLLWLDATLRFSLYMLSDHLLQDVRNFTTEDGHSLLWAEAITFLNHSGASLRPEDAIVACGQRQHGLLGHYSRHFEHECDNIINLRLREWLLGRSIINILANTGAI